MKKILIILCASILLSACSGNNEKEDTWKSAYSTNHTKVKMWTCAGATDNGRLFRYTSQNKSTSQKVAEDTCRQANGGKACIPAHCIAHKFD